MFGAGSNAPDEDPPAVIQHYFRIEVSEYMLTRLKSVMVKQAADQTNKALIEALDLAERVNLPFTPPVDWDRLERWAQRGYDLVSQIEDGKEPQGEPPENKGEAK
jgi:hypothetical protein